MESVNFEKKIKQCEHKIEIFMYTITKLQIKKKIYIYIKMTLEGVGARNLGTSTVYMKPQNLVYKCTWYCTTTTVMSFFFIVYFYCTIFSKTKCYFMVLISDQEWVNGFFHNNQKWIVFLFIQSFTQLYMYIYVLRWCFLICRRQVSYIANLYNMNCSNALEIL